jgi:hypothetical protein
MRARAVQRNTRPVGLFYRGTCVLFLRVSASAARVVHEGVLGRRHSPFEPRNAERQRFPSAGITDLLNGVPSQMPARYIAEMRQERVNARLCDRGANGVFDLVVAVHRDVDPPHLYLFRRLPPVARPEFVAGVE